MALANNPNGGVCYEWPRPIFTSVGNEYDWAKLYWDLFTDSLSTLGNKPLLDYLQLEGKVTGWTRSNHADKIVAILHANNTTMEAAFRAAAKGNTNEGTPH